MTDNTAKQEMTLKGRERLTITEVSSVLSFDEEYLKASTALGIVIVEGKDLIIENLSKEKKEIFVTGRIDKIEFYEQKKKK